MVFESWSKHTRQMVAQRKKLTKVLKLALHRVEKVAFTRWYEQAHTVAEGRQVASRVVRKLLNSSLSRAWTVWVEQVEMGNELRQVASRVVRKLLNSSLSRAWTLWVEQVEMGNELRATAGRVLGIMLNRNLAAAFQAWVERSQEVKRGTQLAWRCVQRIMFRGLFMCFEAWQSFLVDEREARAKAEQDRKANERLETHQSETRVLRDRVMQLEMELESIRQILEWRAGEEYLRLVKASLGYVPPGWEGGVGRNVKGKKKRIPSNRVWDDRYDTRELSRAICARFSQECVVHSAVMFACNVTASLFCSCRMQTDAHTRVTRLSAVLNRNLPAGRALPALTCATQQRSPHSSIATASTPQLRSFSLVPVSSRTRSFANGCW